MKITNVEPILLEDSQVYQTSASGGEVIDHGNWQMLVKVSTDEGLVGWPDAETLAPVAVSIISG